MDNNLTDITIVLDESGSMSPLANDTIGGLNRFLLDQQRAPGEAVISLIKFNDKYTPEYIAKDSKVVEPITARTYKPRGGTALLEALSRAITGTGERLKTMGESYRPGKVIFVVITDGEENCSPAEYTLPDVKKAIKHQTEVYSWDFVFLGANQDAIQAGTGLGVGAGNSMTFSATAKGVMNVYETISANTLKYRGGDASMKTAFFSPEDRAKQTSI